MSAGLIKVQKMSLHRKSDKITAIRGDASCGFNAKILTGFQAVTHGPGSQAAKYATYPSQVNKADG